MKESTRKRKKKAADKLKIPTSALRRMAKTAFNLDVKSNAYVEIEKLVQGYLDETVPKLVAVVEGTKRKTILAKDVQFVLKKDYLGI